MLEEYKDGQEARDILDCMRGSRGGGGGPDPHQENHKALGFRINTGLDLMENHKATKAAFNVGPPSARQRNAI